MRYAARTDANHAAIVKALRKAGRTVVSLHRVGCDVPDLLVGNNGINFLLEIKIEKGKLSEGQKDFAESWRGEVTTVRSELEAIEATQA
jgi:Holliday junction resolvase